jgi:biotin operon repressor
MPQRQLPIFPAGSTAITNEIAFEVREGRVFYFNGHLPVFTHDIADIASFRLFTTQLIENGTVSQGNIAKVFGISLTTIKRCVKRYREKGPEAFYVSGPRRKGKKLTPERLLEVQGLLNQGESVPAASTRVGILANTIHKAIDDGRLQKPSQVEKTVELYPLIGDSEGGSETNTVAIAGVTTKSERSQADVEGVFGMATLRGMERVAAAIGLIEAAPLQFEPADDVPNGGVLLALPALIELGLLRHTLDSFSLPKGFYPIESIFIVLALLALARVRSLESLRYQAPGEWGKLIGLDRIPEVKTLRQKLTLLCKEPGRVKRWSSTLAKTWMEAAPHAAGTIYIDGHVRVPNDNYKSPSRTIKNRHPLACDFLL